MPPYTQPRRVTSPAGLKWPGLTTAQSHAVASQFGLSLAVAVGAGSGAKPLIWLPEYCVERRCRPSVASMRSWSQVSFARDVAMSRPRASWTTHSRRRGQPRRCRRLGPVHAARAEAAWLNGDLATARREARAGFELAERSKDPWVLAELACWRWRVGDLDVLPEPATGHSRSSYRYLPIRVADVHVRFG